MKTKMLKIVSLCLILTVVSMSCQKEEISPEEHNQLIDQELEQENVAKCANGLFHPKSMATNPEYAARFEATKKRLQQAAKSNTLEKNATLRIPVVFNILTNRASVASGWDDNALEIVISRLNDEFNQNGIHHASRDPYFANIEGTPNIEFVFSHRNVRYSVNTDQWDVANESLIENNIMKINGGGLNPADPHNYFNIYIMDKIRVNNTGTLIGAGYNISTNPNYSGLLFDVDYLNDADELAHEVGHYFFLFHTFEGGCSTDNDIFLGANDTPQQGSSSNATCGQTMTTCGSKDNVNNYMDYTHCGSMYTKGQVTQMRKFISIELPNLPL
jgi:hypothetical protein